MQKNRPSGHHRTTLSGYIFATKACIDNWKKLVKLQCLPYMSSQYGELRPTAAEICWRVWGTPANFNVLAALRNGTLVVGVSQTLRHWTVGATYIWQGSQRPSRWALAHILVPVTLKHLAVLITFALTHCDAGGGDFFLNTIRYYFCGLSEISVRTITFKTKFQLANVLRHLAVSWITAYNNLWQCEIIYKLY